MSEKSSKIWSFMLPLSLVVLAAAYYIKVPSVRKEVDAKAPWVRDILGRFVAEPEVKTIVVKSEQPAAIPRPVEAHETPKPSVAAVDPAKAPESSSTAQSAPLDLQKIASDRSIWPKKVTLKNPANFPAVLNGKVVGSLIAPAGAEANLVSIKDDKVGLEFNGGGAWVPVAETDLLARVHSAR